jgi:thiol-disulfide isomerase/thioredoxin
MIYLIRTESKTKRINRKVFPVMLKHTPIRILFIVMYFLFCTACGAPSNQTQEQPAEDEGRVADDVNYLGGGTQPPSTEEEEPAYRSPTLSTAPPPTSLTWVSSVDQAAATARRDGHKKVVAWFVKNNCPDCREIEEDVLQNPDVAAESRRWLFVRINLDRDPEAGDYYLSGGTAPAFAFIDQNGGVYRRYFGSVTPEEFITMLKTWY